MLTKQMSRWFLSLALILGASLLSVIIVRKRYVPSTPSAPAFRQKGDGRIKIVEFSDFQCPACAAAFIPLKQILTIYGKDIQVHFKHFPLETIHRYARLAAGAAECAGQQGKFWEFHDILFSRQRQWTNAKVETHIHAYVEEIGLSLTDFETCMKDPSINAAIDTDVEDGANQWVSSTPTFFINGKRFVGARQLSTVGTLWIEKELKK